MRIAPFLFVWIVSTTCAMIALNLMMTLTPSKAAFSVLFFAVGNVLPSMLFAIPKQTIVWRVVEPLRITTKKEDCHR